MAKRFLLLALVTLLALSSRESGATEFVSMRGAIAASSAQASEAGAEMLRRGGNAFDAVIAAALVEGVVQPYHSGLGGGGFMIGYRVKPPPKEPPVVVVDFREVAPGAATEKMYLRDGKPDPTRSQIGPLAIAVPGAAGGYAEVERRFGRLGLPVVTQPAIDAAEKGFRVTPLYREAAQSRLDCLKKDADAASIFLARSGDRLGVPALGTRIVQRDLARTLRSYAGDGGASFYRGALARQIVSDVTGKGGVLSVEDMQKYAVRSREPLWGSHRGHRIATVPPPSGGGVTVLAILGVLEKLEPLPFHSPKEIHFFVEASKQIYADRAAWFGDPAFVSTDLGPFGTREYADVVRRKIDPSRARPAVEVRPITAVEITSRPSGHTTHIAVVDAEGNAAALTTTVNDGFGSCVVAHGTGVVLNDEMDDFAQAPGVPNAYGVVTSRENAVAPGKVPLSSMAPTIVFQKDKPEAVFAAIGAMGGPFIPTGVAWALVNLLDHHMPIDEAIAATRVHHQYLPDVTYIEPPGLEAATQAALTAMGHHTEVLPERKCDAEAVVVDPETGWRHAASDPRWEGVPSGE